MDQKQFAEISTILGDDTITTEDQISAINKVLGIDITDKEQAKALKEKVLGFDTIEVTVTTYSTSVSFGGVTTASTSFALAFIRTLIGVINLKAIAGFLPEPKQPKTASASKRDGLASPAPGRTLPVTGKNY